MFVNPPMLVTNPTAPILFSIGDMFAKKGMGTTGTVSNLLNKEWYRHYGDLTHHEWSIDVSATSPLVNLTYKDDLKGAVDDMLTDWKFTSLDFDIGLHFPLSSDTLYTEGVVSTYPMLYWHYAASHSISNSYYNEVSLEDSIQYLSDSHFALGMQSYTTEFVLFDDDDFEIEFGNQLIDANYVPVGAYQNYWKIRIERQEGTSEVGGTRAKVSFVAVPFNAQLAEISPAWVDGSAETQGFFSSKNGQFNRPIYLTQVWMCMTNSLGNDQSGPPPYSDGESLQYHVYWTIHTQDETGGHATICRGTDFSPTLGTADIYYNYPEWWGAQMIVPWVSTEDMDITDGISTTNSANTTTELRGFQIIPDTGNSGSILAAKYRILGIYESSGGYFIPHFDPFVDGFSDTNLYQ